MTDRETIDAITEAFERSTRSDNAFARTIDGIAWAARFHADGEHYYITAGGMALTTPSLDPFEVTREWPAVFDYADNSGAVDVFGRVTTY